VQFSRTSDNFVAGEIQQDKRRFWGRCSSAGQATILGQVKFSRTSDGFGAGAVQQDKRQFCGR